MLVNFGDVIADWGQCTQDDHNDQLFMTTDASVALEGDSGMYFCIN